MTIGRCRLGALIATLAALLLVGWVVERSSQKSEPISAFKDCQDCPEMVALPTGAYTMGSPTSEKGRFKNEGPQRHVALTDSLAVAKYEVTRAEFARFVADSGYATQAGCTDWTGGTWELNPSSTWENPGFSQTESEPVVCVTWNDAKAYVDWLSKKTGNGYRLLSEAEWEFMCRAETATARPWGDKLSRNDANYGADDCCQPYGEGRDRWAHTAPVGSFAPNSFGLYDTIGNVWEWVEDCWNENYVGAPSDGSPWRSGGCGKRVIRGGSWYSNPRRVRSAVRYAFGTGVNRTKVGFRVARPL
jgi:formylglycine-generating enzyme